MFEVSIQTLFQQFAALLLLASLLGMVAVLLRQPLIIAFIAAGILAGPAVLGWVQADEPIRLLAEVGVAVLLFVVGLRLDLRLVRSLGAVALATGLGQVVFTAVIGYLLGLALGLDTITAAYVALALTFSSTIIIVKLLSDKREIDALHGRIAVGFLIVQDLVVMVAMIGLSAFGAGIGEGSLGKDVLLTLLRGLLLLALTGLLMRVVLPPVLHQLARSRELLVLFAIALALGMAVLADALGYTNVVGAFLAGVALASSRYRESIASRLVTLRDFLLLFFFIDLGANLNLGLLHMQVPAALLLSLFVLVGNPVIVMAIMGGMGFRKRTGFLAGLTVAQISEFSLVLMALGFSLGHVNEEAVGLVTLVGLITIGLSTYMILYSSPLYERLAPWLGLFEQHMPYREERYDDTEGMLRFDIILFGLGRYGSQIAEGLRGRGFCVLGVDFDPQLVLRWHQQGLPAYYGDAEDPEFPQSLPLSQAQWVVTTIAELDANLTLLESLRHHGYQGRIACAAHQAGDAKTLQQAGVDRVLMPFADAADRTVEILIEETSDPSYCSPPRK